jgi:hypothetical protein
MRARLTSLLAVATLALAATPAAAQTPLTTPTPTPTPTATPPAATPTPTPTPSPEEQQDAKDRKTKSVKRIYRDFERDGRIDDCDHTEAALKKARRSIAADYAEEYPDFRDALTAALQRHRDGKCVEATPTPSPTASATPAPSTGTTTPPPPPAATPVPAPPPPASSPDSGSLPGFGGDSGSGGGSSGGSKKNSGGSGTLNTPGEGDIPEGALPSPTPAATPTPQALPPKLVVTRAGTAPSLFAPGIMLAIALAGLLIAGLTALFAKRTGRLAGVGHAWQEAAWRASGTWSEFTDWLRSGR